MGMSRRTVKIMTAGPNDARPTKEEEEKEERIMLERGVLKILYINTEGAAWSQNSGWLGHTKVDQWYGITTNEDGFVAELELGDNQLLGTACGLQALLFTK